MVENRKQNRLIHQKSPYLLQHAYNPVDWYPWGPEAFSRALREDKPIFLSIGYSTCHWCHVMERESFEDEEVAVILNKSFVAIKVDREERPDIDHIYMSVCQALTGSGGWPLTVILTPDKKPIYAGTYFPKTDRMGMPGLISLLNKVSGAWKEKKEALIESGDRITETLRQSEEARSQDSDEATGLGNDIGNVDTMGSMGGIEALGDTGFNRLGVSSEALQDMIEEAFSHFVGSFDETYGGFGNAPKFPTPHNLYFLLRYWHAKKDPAALGMVKKTLDAMRRGGIYDHIGFGFSRYSTDRKWLVPHFEKMLYDNALLALAYLEAYQASKKEIYKATAEEIFTYVLRDMTSPEGGFYSAEDADSEGVEGKFYVWTPEEIKRVLGEANGKLFCSTFDITDRGNFEGHGIPNLIGYKPWENIAGHPDDGTVVTGTSPHISTDGSQTADRQKIEEFRQKLFDYREKRIHPYKDDKILTAWNGLMIAALSMGGRILGNPKYTEAAEKAVKFIYTHLFSRGNNDVSVTTSSIPPAAGAQPPAERPRLLARYRDGNASIPAFVDDYAFLTWGLVELYETTFNAEYLNHALDLNDGLIRLFWDDRYGGFFIYGKDGEELIFRPKDIYDGAAPSGNSVAALNLIRLARLTGRHELEDRAIRMLDAFQRQLRSYPAG